MKLAGEFFAGATGFGDNLFNGHIALFTANLAPFVDYRLLPVTSPPQNLKLVNGPL